MQIDVFLINPGYEQNKNVGGSISLIITWVCCKGLLFYYIFTSYLDYWLMSVDIINFRLSQGWVVIQRWDLKNYTHKNGEKNPNKQSVQKLLKPV